MKSVSLLVLVILLSISSLPPLLAVGHAEDCVDYGDRMHWVGSYFYSSCRDLAQRGDLLFMVAAAPTLRIIDTSEVMEPTIVGELDIPGVGSAIVLVGDLAYVANGGTGLAVVDISNTAAPVRVGEVDTPSHAGGVSVVGDYAYVTCSAAGVQVIDISNPAAPIVAATINTPGFLRGVAVTGHHLYLIETVNGQPGTDLLVYDISNPLAPQYVTGINVAGSGSNIDIHGQYAFISCWNNGIHILDISDPSSPLVTSSLYTGATYGVTAVGDLLYVGGGGLTVVDMSDPTSPFISGVVGGFGAIPPYAVAVVDGYAYESSLSGLHLIDVDPPINAELAAGYATPGNAVRVTIDDEQAFVAMGRDGLHIADIGVPTAPVAVSTTDTPGYASDVAVVDQFAFVTDGDTGTLVLDLTDPTAPELVAAVDAPDSAIVITVADDLAFIVDTHFSLRIVDVADPSTPVVIGAQDLPSTARAVAVTEGHAYVCAGGELFIVDVTVPTAPFIAGQIDTPGYARDVCIVGQYAYLASFIQGIEIVDIADPTTPQYVSGNQGPYRAYSISVADDFAYVGNGGAGLYVVDVTDPLTPSFLGSVNTPSSARDAVVVGGVVYIADEVSGLQMAWRQCADSVPVFLTDFVVTIGGGTVDIGWSTSSATDVGEFRLFGSRDGVRWSVACRADGLRRFAATDLPALEHAGGELLYALEYREPGEQWATLATETVIVTATLPVTRLVDVSPNPFNPRTVIAFEVAQTQRVRIVIVDLAGREVTVLADRVFDRGPQTAAWDGLDSAGRAVASGSYIARLAAAERIDARKIMLLR